MQHLKGTPLSNGLSRGQAYVYSDVLESRQASYNIRKDQFGAEYQRIQNAKESVRRHLFDSVKRIKSAVSRDVADIFIAQESMLVDPQLVDDLKQTLKMRHVNAEQVVGTVFRRWIRKFREAPSQILNQRADDIEDLYRRMMEVLVGIQSHGLERLAPDSIIIARRLLPSDTVFLSQKTCSGILLEIAGQTAHATILAREIGIPCIGQVPGLLQQIETGDELLIDGRTGDITVNPTRKATELFEEARKRNSKSLVLAQRHRFDRSVTADGRAVRILANVGSREDVEAATASGADGIGLFRTEGFFIAAKVLPTTEEYVDYLLHSLEPMGNRSVNLRLLDIGGDKNIPYLNLPFEANPFLGRRGVRLLFDYPALLQMQLEAMSLVSQHRPISILIPMVTFPEEVSRIRTLLRKVVARHRIAEPKLGAMVETPAAALAMASLREVADFLCIGTNDLTQYLMASDRENPLVNDYFRDSHAIVFDLLKTIVKQAGKTPITLCGELAGKRENIARVLKTGLRSLSVAPPLIPAIKEAVRHVRTS